MRAPLAKQPWQAHERALTRALFVVAAALRIWHWDWGLPALQGLDESFFYGLAINAWEYKSPVVSWYGNPGTLLLWLQIPALELARLATLWSGHWNPELSPGANPQALQWIFAAVLRLQHLALAILTLGLAAALGRAVLGAWGGVLTLLFFAFTPGTVEYARIIRTDIPFVACALLAQLAALQLLRYGQRRRVWMIVGAFVGLSVTMRWFGIAVGAVAVGAWLQRGLARPARLLDELPHLFWAGFASLVAFAVTAPFILQRYYTLVDSLLHEMRAFQLTATVADFPSLVGFFLTTTARNFSPAAFVLVPLGVVFLVRAKRAPIAVCAFPVCYLALMFVQNLQWERWFFPVFPWLALLEAGGLLFVFEQLRARSKAVPAHRVRLLAIVAACALVAIPAWTSIRETRAHATDTLTLASEWIKDTLPPSTKMLSASGFLRVDSEAYKIHTVGTVPRRDVRLLALGAAHRVLNFSLDPNANNVVELSDAEKTLARQRLSFRDLGLFSPELIDYLYAENVEYVRVGLLDAIAREDLAYLRTARRPQARTYAGRLERFLERHRLLIENSELVVKFSPIPGRRHGGVVEIRRLLPRPAVAAPAP